MLECDHWVVRYYNDVLNELMENEKIKGVIVCLLLFFISVIAFNRTLHHHGLQALPAQHNGYLAPI